MIFQDRRDAGRFLADRLQSFAAEAPIVLALPRGGVPVGFEIAQALDAPLDVLVARKLGAPSQPEFGFGAVSGERIVLNDDSVDMLGLDEAQIEAIVARERAEAARRETVYRRGREPLEVAGRTVIVVDDGLATGVTARAACLALQDRRPAKTIFAAPVCAADSASALKEAVDEVFCGFVPERFMAVGQWYRDFGQTTDEEVLALLDEAHERRLRRHPQTPDHHPGLEGGPPP